MEPLILVPYAQAESLIEEGDVLLFRGFGFISWMIRKAGQGIHSHVGVASWSNGNSEPVLECVEFREWRGGRTVSLQSQVEQNPNRIDVYRAAKKVENYFFNEKTQKVDYNWKTYDGYSITRCMRRLTGLPYGWKRIWWLARFHVPVVRWIASVDTDDSIKNIYPVCSTVVSHCYRNNYTDLVKLRSDQRTEPADIARSPVLSYLFTIGP